MYFNKNCNYAWLSIKHQVMIYFLFPTLKQTLELGLSRFHSQLVNRKDNKCLHHRKTFSTLIFLLSSIMYSSISDNFNTVYRCRDCLKPHLSASIICTCCLNTDLPPHRLLTDQFVQKHLWMVRVKTMEADRCACRVTLFVLMHL